LSSARTGSSGPEPLAAAWVEQVDPGGVQPQLALLALGVLGLAALLIALVGDLPDAQASGLILGPSGRYALASSSPGVGFYLETLGAVILLIAAGAGLLLTAPVRMGTHRTRARSG